MKVSKLEQSLRVIALISVYLVGWQSVSRALIDTTAPVDLRNRLSLAANKGICSFINANYVNIRSGPGSRYAVVTRLKRGDTVKAIDRKSNWVEISGKVTSKPGATPEVVRPLRGWVYNAYINGCSEDQYDRWRK